MKRVAFVVIGLLSAVLAIASLAPAPARAQGSETDDPMKDLLERVLRDVVNEVTDENENAPARGLVSNPQIPDSINQLAEKIDGAAFLELINQPDEYSGSDYVARVVFEPLRPGYKACPDHYPSYFVEKEASCPSLLDDDPPARGWTKCYSAFYAPESVGCPPQPQRPMAPATTPQPRCDFGPEACKHEMPGGPVLFRAVQTKEITKIIATKKPETQARVLQRTDVSRSAQANVQAQPVQVQPVQRPILMANPELLKAVAGRLQFQLREQPAPQPNLHCQGENCQWGGNDVPIPLPPPPVVPFKYVPCEYENVSFFVPENRYCPKERLGERPGPGAAVYISWKSDNSTPPSIFYHRPDFDGRSLTLMMIYGGSDDRYPITEATDREIAAARATAMLIKTEYVAAAGAGTVTLSDDPAWQPLCSGERFSGLPQPGRCSGVKIGDRLVATSAHCIRNQRQCDQTSVVFSYDGGSDPQASRTVASDSVYQCMSVVASRRPASIGERGADWTIFEVDREIDAPNATLSSSADVRPSVVTTVIGHPMGLPTVVTRLGVVQVATTEYFVANSDTFVGNSGSAVFAAQSVEDNAPRVLGLLTGGGYDFVEGEDCVQAKWCNGPECLGDDVVYTDDLIAALETYALEQ